MEAKVEPKSVSEPPAKRSKPSSPGCNDTAIKQEQYLQPPSLALAGPASLGALGGGLGAPGGTSRLGGLRGTGLLAFSRQQPLAPHPAAGGVAGAKTAAVLLAPAAGAPAGIKAQLLPSLLAPDCAVASPRAAAARVGGGMCTGAGVRDEAAEGMAGAGGRAGAGAGAGPGAQSPGHGGVSKKALRSCSGESTGGSDSGGSSSSSSSSKDELDGSNSDEEGGVGDGSSDGARDLLLRVSNTTAGGNGGSGDQEGPDGETWCGDDDDDGGGDGLSSCGSFSSCDDMPPPPLGGWCADGGGGGGGNAGMHVDSRDDATSGGGGGGGGGDTSAALAALGATTALAALAAANAARGVAAAANAGGDNASCGLGAVVDAKWKRPAAGAGPFRINRPTTSTTSAFRFSLMVARVLWPPSVLAAARDKTTWVRVRVQYPGVEEPLTKDAILRIYRDSWNSKEVLRERPCLRLPGMHLPTGGVRGFPDGAVLGLTAAADGAATLCAMSAAQVAAAEGASLLRGFWRGLGTSRRVELRMERLARLASARAQMLGQEGEQAAAGERAGRTEGGGAAAGAALAAALAGGGGAWAGAGASAAGAAAAESSGVDGGGGGSSHSREFKKACALHVSSAADRRGMLLKVLTFSDLFHRNCRIVIPCNLGAVFWALPGVQAAWEAVLRRWQKRTGGEKATDGGDDGGGGDGGGSEEEVDEGEEEEEDGKDGARGGGGGAAKACGPVDNRTFVPFTVAGWVLFHQEDCSEHFRVQLQVGRRARTHKPCVALGGTDLSTAIARTGACVGDVLCISRKDGASTAAAAIATAAAVAPAVAQTAAVEAAAAAAAAGSAAGASRGGDGGSEEAGGSRSGDGRRRGRTALAAGPVAAASAAVALAPDHPRLRELGEFTFKVIVRDNGGQGRGGGGPGAQAQTAEQRALEERRRKESERQSRDMQMLLQQVLG